jgi:hypothetical protein
MRVLLFSLALLATACQPTFGTPLSLVNAPRLLAVRAEPPEVSAAAPVQLTPLVASFARTVPAPALTWSLCLQPKPAAEDNVVSSACLAPGDTTPVTTGATALVTVPTDACRLFGPEVPPQKAGQPPYAARAPDATGGYYQPVLADLQGSASIVLERITCSPPGASLELAQAFEQSYKPNLNPTLAGLTAAVDGGAVPLSAIPAGASVVFTASWTPDSPETYPVVDAFDQILVMHREALAVSWYVTGGSFLDERTGRAEDDTNLWSVNTWTAPSTPGSVHAWLVLRDSRGGLDFAGYSITVVP